MLHIIITACSLLQLTNRMRVENNITPLRIDERLNKAAQQQACTMCALGKLTHEGSGDLSDRLLAQGFDGDNIGENIAKQQGSDPSEVFRVWADSAEHKKNILGEYEVMGEGFCKRDGDKYWAQVFGRERGGKKVRLRIGVSESNEKDVKGGEERLGEIERALLGVLKDIYITKNSEDDSKSQDKDNSQSSGKEKSMNKNKNYHRDDRRDDNNHISTTTVYTTIEKIKSESSMRNKSSSVENERSTIRNTGENSFVAIPIIEKEKLRLMPIDEKETENGFYDLLKKITAESNISPNKEIPPSIDESSIRFNKDEVLRELLSALILAFKDKNNEAMSILLENLKSFNSKWNFSGYKALRDQSNSGKRHERILYSSKNRSSVSEDDMNDDNQSLKDFSKSKENSGKRKLKLMNEDSKSFDKNINNEDEERSNSIDYEEKKDSEGNSLIGLVKNLEELIEKMKRNLNLVRENNRNDNREDDNQKNDNQKDDNNNNKNRKNQKDNKNKNKAINDNEDNRNNKNDKNKNDNKNDNKNNKKRDDNKKQRSRNKKPTKNKSDDSSKDNDESYKEHSSSDNREDVIVRKILRGLRKEFNIENENSSVSNSLNNRKLRNTGFGKLKKNSRFSNKNKYSSDQGEPLYQAADDILRTRMKGAVNDKRKPELQQNDYELSRRNRNIQPKTLIENSDTGNICLIQCRMNADKANLYGCICGNVDIGTPLKYGNN